MFPFFVFVFHPVRDSLKIDGGKLFNLPSYFHQIKLPILLHNVENKLCRIRPVLFLYVVILFQSGLKQRKIAILEIKKQSFIHIRHFFSSCHWRILSIGEKISPVDKMHRWQNDNKNDKSESVSHCYFSPYSIIKYTTFNIPFLLNL